MLSLQKERANEASSRRSVQEVELLRALLAKLQKYGRDFEAAETEDLASMKTTKRPPAEKLRGHGGSNSRRYSNNNTATGTIYNEASSRGHNLATKPEKEAAAADEKVSSILIKSTVGSTHSWFNPEQKVQKSPKKSQKKFKKVPQKKIQTAMSSILWLGRVYETA
jgi:hypothetical protein